MASSFDRLERFFSYKRKASAISIEAPTEASTGPSTPTDPLDELTFPSPSFIRPKNARMAARDEVHIRQASSRSSSIYDANWPRKTSADSGCALLPSPTRLPSLHIEPFDELVPMFQGFSFPKPPSTRSSANSGSLSFPGLSEDRSSWPNSPLTRLDTPPSEVEESHDASSPTNFFKSKFQAVAPRVLSTSESIQDVGPLSDWQLETDDAVDVLGDSWPTDDQEESSQTAMSPVKTATSRPNSVRILPDDAPPLLLPSCLPPQEPLCEPTTSDFYGLNDYSIAGDHLDDEDLNGPTDLSSTRLDHESVLICQDTKSLVLEPPTRCRTAAVAALEAARIANRYRFDVLYIIDLRPGRDLAEQGSPTASPTPNATGRILTAHGLDTHPTPLRISSDLLLKIVQSPGWNEYRYDSNSDDDLCRLYACSVKSNNPGLPVASQRASEKPRGADQGFVFIGYRKQRNSVSAQDATREELAYLQRDIEALVDMSVDLYTMHQLQQLRRTATADKARL